MPRAIQKKVLVAADKWKRNGQQIVEDLGGARARTGQNCCASPRAAIPSKVGTTIDGGPKFYDLFLVNGGEYDIARMTMRTGGFASVDDEVVKLNESTVDFGAVKTGGAQRLERLDPGILDFMLWYQLDLQFSDGTRVVASFEVPKTYGFRVENYRFCPTLDKKAYVFGLSLRRNEDRQDEPRKPPKT